MNYDLNKKLGKVGTPRLADDICYRNLHSMSSHF